MSYYEGLSFFLALILILLPAMWLGYMEISLRWYDLAVSLLVMVCVFHGSLPQAMLLLAFLAWSIGLVLIYLRLRLKGGRKRGIFHLMLVLSLLPLCLNKVLPLAGMNAVGFTGISYLSFRVAQILIETYDGVIDRLSPLETLSFFTFFPSFSSGPIDRSRRFSADLAQPPARDKYVTLCADGLQQLLTGAVAKFVLSAFAYKLMGFLDTPDARWIHHMAYAYAYSLYLYFDFAGYSAMAVGTAAVLGVRLPDNFNRPFVSIDIREFWNRWHISLSHWFRDFVFTRFVMFSSKKKLFGNRLGRACAGFLVNMLIMGAWHGLSPCYLLYGLYHGCLLAVTELYQKKSLFYKKNKQKRWYRRLSWFITLQLVVFGFYLFSGKLI